MSLTQLIFDSPIGPLHLVASEKGLQGLHWKRQKAPLIKELDHHSSSHKHLEDTSLQLKEYFEGERKQFELDLDIKGTDFQITVWNELNKIPYGKTKTYSEIARKIGNAKAVRAVGSANRIFCLITLARR